MGLLLFLLIIAIAFVFTSGFCFGYAVAAGRAAKELRELSQEFNDLSAEANQLSARATQLSSRGVGSRG